MSNADTGGAPARGAIGLIFDPWFGSIFWGKLLSGLGVWIHSIVAVLIIYQATGSALWAGFTTVVQFVPHILLSTLSGKWSDQGNAVHQMILGRIVSVVGTGFVAVYCFVYGVPHDELGTLAVLAGTAVTGVGYVLGLPAQQSIIPLLIRPGELGLAMALNSLPMTLSRVAGPALGAVLAAHANVGLAFALAAATHVVFVVLLAFAHLPASVKAAPDSDFSVRTALVYVKREKPMLMLLLAVGVIGFGSDPSITLAPFIAERVGADTQFVGFITGCFGAGAASGFFVYRLARRWLSEGQVLKWGLGMMAVSTVLITMSANPVAVLLAFAAVGIGFSPALTASTTLIQALAPVELRGRIMALWSLGFIGSRPVAAALSGYLADTVSLDVSIVAIALVLAVLFIAFQPRRLPPELRLAGL